MREHTGIALGIAGAVTSLLTLFAAFLVVLVWVALSIYALVKWIGSAPDSASPTTVALILVGLVTALALVVALPVVILGRSMTPPKRGRGEEPGADLPTIDAVVEPDQRTATS